MTLILSAWAPEIQPLVRWLRTAAGRPFSRTVLLAPAGVGAVDAGIGATRAIAANRPTRVIFVGTAGRYLVGRRDSVAPLLVPVVPRRLSLVSTAAVRGDGYLPAPLVTTLDAAPELTAALLQSATQARSTTAACPLAITRTLSLGRRIAAATGAEVENLEAFSVGRAAALAGVPFAAVFGLANRVGPAAHVEWQQHHLAASRAACRLLSAWLSSGR